MGLSHDGGFMEHVNAGSRHSEMGASCGMPVAILYHSIAFIKYARSGEFLSPRGLRNLLKSSADWTIIVRKEVLPCQSKPLSA